MIKLPRNNKKINKLTRILNLSVVIGMASLCYIQNEEFKQSRIPAEFKKEGIERSILCMAKNIYHEARGESVEGQKAVMQVTLNRVKKNNSDICTEVYKYKQFSWTLEIKKIKTIPNNMEFLILKSNIENWMSQPSKTKLSSNHDHYHEASINPEWNRKMKNKIQIGNHIFMASR